MKDVSSRSFTKELLIDLVRRRMKIRIGAILKLIQMQMVLKESGGIVVQNAKVSKMTKNSIYTTTFFEHCSNRHFSFLFCYC